ncbi:hypothetical protein [Chelatococcus asaccharovorans]|uniref:hypothetical protein n=1 Tax=Chelatococcus asaccharovorans TaxID=28210 RepID=UPI0014748610|nr:hypothetical protein [Chelatococcus asaccharovorans]MBS7703521.1 hypothetical protein [Chelatococcus asaccharovorans]
MARVPILMDLPTSEISKLHPKGCAPSATKIDELLENGRVFPRIPLFGPSACVQAAAAKALGGQSDDIFLLQGAFVMI